MSDILAELEWRGLYADCTDREALAKRLAEGPTTLYCGFDPTADSLHVGNLVPLLALPQATHYLLDAWIWKVRPGNETAAAAMGLPPAADGVERSER